MNPWCVPVAMTALVAGAILAVVVVTSVRQSSGSGQMCSAEHGHYHDASGREIPRWHGSEREYRTSEI